MDRTERNEADHLIHDYVNKASSLTGSSLAALITEATSNPTLFAFSEILAVPAVTQLEGTEHSNYVDLLRLFAYGTWTDYKSKSSSLPQLVPEQVLKLKQLTVLSVAENYKNVIPYDALMEAIDAASVRELEDFLIDECIYMGIVKGKLNLSQSCLEVQEAAARDPKPGQLEKITDTLSTWLSTSDKLVLSTEENIKLAETMSGTYMQEAKEHTDTLNILKESPESKRKEGGLRRSTRKRKQAG